MPKFLLPMLAFILAATPFAEANAGGSADAPSLKVGDQWTLNIPYYGGEITRVIMEIDGDGTITAVDTGPKGKLTRKYTKDWNPIGGDELGYHGEFVRTSFYPASCFYRFPMAVGKQWACDYSLSTGSKFRMDYHFTAKVVAFEHVTTKAGTFDAFRIETVGNGVAGTAWYAPATRSPVKVTVPTMAQFNTDLVSYQLK